MKQVKFVGSVTVIGLMLGAVASVPALAANPKTAPAESAVPVFQLETVVVTPTAAQMAQLNAFHAKTAPQNRWVDNNRHDAKSPAIGCAAPQTAYSDNPLCLHR